MIRSRAFGNRAGYFLTLAICVNHFDRTILPSVAAEELGTPTLSRHVRPAPPVSPLPRVQEFSDTEHAKPGVRLQSIPTGLTLYSIGNPSDDEQLYLELLNRSRANPPAEGERLRNTTNHDVLQDFETFKVDLAKLVADFNTINPAPPLSMNSNLTAAARLHSRDMLTNQFQGHTSSNGSTTGDRITAQAYPWSAFGENVFSNARSVEHGHAAFDVDWGGGDASVGGVQNPPGHRNTIHDPIYREVGIGVVLGSNGKVGPQLVTQDFGSRRNLTPLVTGVAFYDLNQNGFYDVGEGIEGATVLVESSRFYAISAAAGGYSVPVPGDATYTVTFGLSGLSETKKTIGVAGNQNAKVDFAPAYSPPIVSGPDRPVVGQNNRYQFTAVGGARSYQWKQNRRMPAQEREGAENGTARVVVMASAGYEVVDPSVRATGNFSFHLAHPEKEDQILTLTRLYLVTESSQLIFASRLGWAGTAQTAKAQVSSDGGATWQDVWTRVGTESSGQRTFGVESIPLRPFAGKEIAVRFRFDFGSGTFLRETDPGVGFYVDDIGVTDADELFDEAVSDVSTGTSFFFSPSQSVDYALRVRGRFASRALPWGPAKLVTAQPGGALPPSVKIISVEKISGARVQIEFEVAVAAPAGLDLESAETIDSTWTLDSTASIVPLPEAGRFRAVTSSGADAQRYFRVGAR